MSTLNLSRSPVHRVAVTLTATLLMLLLVAPAGIRGRLASVFHDQGVAVELPAEVQGGAVVPAGPDRPDRQASSRMRAAGCDHGIEKRFSTCAWICEPSPRTNLPRDAR